MQFSISNFDTHVISLISSYLPIQEVNRSLSSICKDWHRVVESREFWDAQIKRLDSRTFVQAALSNTVKQLKDHFINYILPRSYILKKSLLIDEINVGTATWFTTANSVYKLIFRLSCLDEIIVLTKSGHSIFAFEKIEAYALARWSIQEKKLIEILPAKYDFLLRSIPTFRITKLGKQELLLNHFNGTLQIFYLPSPLSIKKRTISKECNIRLKGWSCNPMLKSNDSLMKEVSYDTNKIKKIFLFSSQHILISCGYSAADAPNHWLLLHNLSSNESTLYTSPYFHSAENRCLISTRPDQSRLHQNKPLVLDRIQVTLMGGKTNSGIALKGHPGKEIKKVITKVLKDLYLAVSIAKGDPIIKLWSLQNVNNASHIEAPIRELTHLHVQEIAFSQHFLISVSYYSGLIKVWDVYTGECLQEIITDKEISTCCIHPSKMRVAYGTITGKVYIHYLDSKKS